MSVLCDGDSVWQVRVLRVYVCMYVCVCFKCVYVLVMMTVYGRCV
jgi:hypothetical protein